MGLPNVDALKCIMGFIDLTFLNSEDHYSHINKLCNKAVNPVGHVAAICVYPKCVHLVAQKCMHSIIKVATVLNFPHGNDSLETVIKGIEVAMIDGANELDIVFPYQNFLNGEAYSAEQFVQSCKKACQNNTLKIILETGALRDKSIIEEAANLALAAGADFIKTSTGKIAQGATLGDVEIILNAIKTYKKSHNREVGCKVSGGIKTFEDAMSYLHLAEKMLGTDWISPKTFRIGASQLVDDLIKKYTQYSQ